MTFLTIILAVCFGFMVGAVAAAAGFEKKIKKGEPYVVDGAVYRMVKEDSNDG